MTKTLVLVRHAHRDTAQRAADNGLTKKGRDQARAVKRFYKERFGKAPALLVSSPKRRCRETLQPLAEKIGARVKTDDRLLEGTAGLSSRAAAFLAWWKLRAPRRVVACSHGGWIPAFLGRALDAPISLKKGGWAEISFDGEEVRLDALLQKLPS